jgi:hypothetical protein
VLKPACISAFVGTATCLAALAVPAFAQQPIFYPAKGQSAEQLNRDRGECRSWAQQTTGIDPVALAQAPPAATAGPSGPAIGGGERIQGAARGAVLGEVMGDHGGEGAVAGAMVGGARARRNQAERQRSAQHEAQAARDSTIGTYNRAVAACMEGRGYTVR